MTDNTKSTDELDDEQDTKTIEVDSDVLEGISRRDLIRGTAATGVALALGSTAFASSAMAAPSGTVPAPSEPAWERIRVGKISWAVLSSDPSSTNGGDMWVVE